MALVSECFEPPLTVSALPKQCPLQAGLLIRRVTRGFYSSPAGLQCSAGRVFNGLEGRAPLIQNRIVFSTLHANFHEDLGA
jgi:hypothetical protein